MGGELEEVWLVVPLQSVRVLLTPQVTSNDLKQVGMPQASLQHTDLRDADFHKAHLRLRDSRLTRHAGLSRVTGPDAHDPRDDPRL